MKNKLRLIDVSMLSSYMGRVLTGIVTIFVVSVAVSAWFHSGGWGVEREVIRVCVHSARPSTDSQSMFEPLRALLSRETRSPVILSACGSEWPRGFDLYIMPANEYLAFEKTLGIRALFEIQSSMRSGDRAVVVSGEPTNGELPAAAEVDDIVFAHPLSVNGFWVQAEALERAGMRMPQDLRRLRFGGPTPSGERVIFGVVCGAYRFGACKLSEVTELVRGGSLEAGELYVTHAGEALPELIVAAREKGVDFLARGLERVSRHLDEVASPAREDETVALLKSRGVHGLLPIASDRMAEVRRLYGRYGAVFDTTTAVWP